jgi:micrococcal nuclease
MWTYRAKLDRCVDGDTADLQIDLGFNIFINIRVRLLGVNTPERGRPNFKEATELLEHLCSVAKDDEGYIYISTGKTGKYGRWIATLGSSPGDMSINKTLAESWPGYGVEKLFLD